MNITWNCCRICLLTDDTMQSIHEIDEQDHLLYSEKLEECGGISVKLDSILPEVICFKCRENLDVAYKFRQDCQKSNRFLRTFVGDEENLKNIFKSPNDFNAITNEEFQIKAELLDENCICLTTEKNENITTNKTETCLLNLIEKHDSPQLSVYLPEYEENENSEQSCVSENGKEITVILDVDHKMKKYKLMQQYKKKHPFRGIRKEKSIETNVMAAKDSSIKRRRKSFSSSSETLDRMKSSKSIDIHICEICGNKYNKKYNLKSHMRRHQNDKPFSCEVCQKTFASNSELGRHMRIHTGLKPYECKFCGRKFSDFSTCSKHQRTHTNERPFKCEECGKGFNYSHVLKAHMLTHTGEKAFSCEPCGKTFAKKHHLTQHFATIVHQRTLTT